MKLNTNSNVYTFVYAVVMVIIVAFLLAFVSSALKDTQEANVANDTKGQILSALRIDKNAVDVQATFAEKVQDKLFQNGELVPYESDFLTSYGQAIKDGELHVFEASVVHDFRCFSFTLQSYEKILTFASISSIYFVK